MNISSVNNVSFGMAKFTKEGMRLAHESGVSGETIFNNGKFYEDNYIFNPPFYKYVKKTLPLKTNVEPKDVKEVAYTIIEHGTGVNARTNAIFIRQLMHPKTQGYIEKLQEKQPETSKMIVNAERIVFDANWNNPELSKGKTKELLDIVKSTMSDTEEYSKWSGIIENSDAKPSKK